MSISLQWGRAPKNHVVPGGHGNTCNFISFKIYLGSTAIQNPLRSQETSSCWGICLSESETACASTCKIRLLSQQPTSMSATCITKVMNLSVVVASAEFHLQTDGWKALSRALITHHFLWHLLQVPTFISLHHSPVAEQKMSFVYSALQACQRLCWDPKGLIVLKVK